MKLKLTTVLLSLLILGSCAKQRPVKNCETFAELPDPNVDTASWVGASPDVLNASYVSIDKKYPKSTMPVITEIVKAHKVEGWKGEKLSAQILLWAATDVAQVEFEISDFKSAEATLPSSIAQARFVRYVMTDEFAGGCGHRKPEDFAASLAADMLDNLDCFNIEAKTVRPVWVTVEIPRDAKEGLYTATIDLYARNHEKQQFTLEVDVINKVLPEPTEWTMHFDQWQHPSAVARIHNVEMWSDAHFDHLKAYMQMAANMGQKVITATLNKDPWNIQCFDPYADMITWTKNGDGTWTYDYKVFDRWVQFMMDLGVKKMINCYSMIPWNNEIHYVDGATKETINVKADPGTKVFDDMWIPFLKDFVKHLKEKGWLKITNIAMDERSPKEMEATVATLQKYAPELGIALADNHESYKRYPFIKDMCVAAGAPVDHADIVDRRERGLITTYYVCCSDEFPNTFTFSEPAEAAYISWYAVAADYDGFLRWAFNSWVENPLTDSRFRTWPAGDTYLIYPDARSSIRYERTVEGVQDFEKIQILRKELAAKNETAKLEELNQIIAKFNSVKRTATWNEDLNKAKAFLNQLAREL